MTQLSIPNFFVYGEPSRALDVGFLHVETVRERNSAHFGHVAPHQHRHMGQITYWTSGSGQYQIEDTNWNFSAPAVSFVPSMIVHGFSIEPDADAIVISIADSLLKDIAGQTSLELDRPTFFAGLPQDETWPRLAMITSAIASEHGDDRPASQTIMTGLVGVSLSLIARLSAASPAAVAAPNVPLAIRFRHAVDAHYRQDWSIADYVEVLGTTEHLLAKACAEVLGNSIKAVILERRLLEAKRLLMFTIRPVEEIGFEIGFSDPSYFSRFFRRGCGVSPKVWRQIHSG